MGEGLPGFLRLEKVMGAALIFCLFSAFFLSVMTIAALAGTETGEFCPTCPDWTDLDGWLAKKDAYEKAEQDRQNGQLSGPANGQAGNSSSVSSSKANPEDGYARPEFITDPSAINGDRIILDVRSAENYLAGHIPGALNLYWKDMQKDGVLDISLAQEALGRAGVNENDRLMVYGGSDDGAAFVFWALSYLGQNNVSVLDGGIDAAREAAVALATNATSPLSSNYTAHIVPSLLVTPEGLKRMISRSDVRILDAREFSDYGQSRLGNESICLSLDKLYEDSRIKRASTLKDLFGRRLDPSSTAIVYGTPQAYRLFYSLRLMGYNATVLEGDWWKETKWAVSNVT
jgi:thiosulfate/3-mercaptopyruvate sulfurtransferase